MFSTFKSLALIHKLKFHMYTRILPTLMLIQLIDVPS